MLGQSSTALKMRILSGAFRTDRPGIEKLHSDQLDCPPYLDEIAKEKWAELCQALHDTAFFTQVDRDVMAMYCSAFSQWRQATDMVKKSGLVIKGASGVCANPCVKIAADAMREMRGLAALLGM
jgi:P27 family predicted phage terminase small subunit